MLQGLLLLPGQHGEGPPGVALDPHPAALLREGTGQKMRDVDIFSYVLLPEKQRLHSNKSTHFTAPPPGPQACVLPVPGVLHGPVPHQHHDQPRHPGRLRRSHVPGQLVPPRVSYLELETHLREG